MNVANIHSDFQKNCFGKTTCEFDFHSSTYFNGKESTCNDPSDQIFLQFACEMTEG